MVSVARTAEAGRLHLLTAQQPIGAPAHERPSAIRWRVAYGAHQAVEATATTLHRFTAHAPRAAEQNPLSMALRSCNLPMDSSLRRQLLLLLLVDGTDR